MKDNLSSLSGACVYVSPVLLLPQLKKVLSPSMCPVFDEPFARNKNCEEQVPGTSAYLLF